MEQKRYEDREEKRNEGRKEDVEYSLPCVDI
jgi:hypothetical protein